MNQLVLFAHNRAHVDEQYAKRDLDEEVEYDAVVTFFQCRACSQQVGDHEECAHHFEVLGMDSGGEVLMA